MHDHQYENRTEGKAAVQTTASQNSPGPKYDADGLEALLAAIAAGDKAAFTAFYKQTAGKLLGIAFRILQNRQHAEEILQESYLAVWQKAGQFNSEVGSAIAWISTIVRHRAIDRVRMISADRTVAVGDSTDLDMLSNLETANGDFDFAAAQSLKRCLDNLRQRPRELILLAFGYGFTHDELSHKTNSPLGTVKSDLRRGLENLKGCLNA